MIQYRRKRKSGRRLRLIFLLAVVLFGLFRFNFGAPVEVKWLKDTPIAHRGLHSDKYDENSLGAFSNAIEQGYAIEFDVRLTKDKELVIFHDSGLSRLLKSNATIANSTLDDLKKHRLPITNETIPTFKETLGLVNTKVPMLIEIKNFWIPGQLEEKLVAELEGYEGEYAVQSFNPFVCRWFRKNAPAVTVGLLLNDIPRLKHKWVRTFKDNLFALICKPNFIAYDYAALTKDASDHYRKSGLILLGYGLDVEAVQDKSYLPLVDNPIFDLSLD